MDRVIKEFKERIATNVSFRGFTLGNELQSHVAEIKVNTLFRSFSIFEEIMHSAVLKIDEASRLTILYIDDLEAFKIEDHLYADMT